MLRRTLIKAAALAATSLTPPVAALAQPGAGTPETVPPGSPAATPASPTVETGYAPVNGLEMYFEIHGGGGSGQPLLMLHGGLATIGFPGGHLLPLFARSRPVIAIEQQGHGRTADIDRPLTYEQMVEDTAALIRHLGFAQVDVFGHSMGGTTALGLAIGHPDLVRKLVIVAAIFSNAGMRSENLAGMQGMTPEGLAGTPMEAAYLDIAPNPEDWPALHGKLGQLSRDFTGWAADDLRALAAPTLAVVGDADAVHLEHAVELLRLRGGDVNGDFAGVPASQLAVLPGTTHFGSLARADLLLPIVTPFLDAPAPA